MDDLDIDVGQDPGFLQASRELSTASLIVVSRACGLSNPRRWRFLAKNSETEMSRCWWPSTRRRRVCVTISGSICGIVLRSPSVVSRSGSRRRFGRLRRQRASLARLAGHAIGPGRKYAMILGPAAEEPSGPSPTTDRTIAASEGHRPMETTLIILKPDAVQRGLMGKIITRFEEKGLQIVARDDADLR